VVQKLGGDQRPDAELTAARFQAVGFNDITLLEVVETLKGNPAIGAGGHLGDFVPEMAQTGDGGFVNNLAIPHDPHACAAVYTALGDPAARYLRAPAG
jgi:hypothetical protein